MNLENKVVILTGAGGLIGNATLDYLLKRKAIIVAIDMKPIENTNCDFVQTDVTSSEAIDKLIKNVMQKYGRVDGLVNLAYPRTDDWGLFFEKIPLASWQKNVDMQMNAVFYICQQVLEIMKKQGNGSVVNIGSIYGVVGNDFTIYEEYGGTSAAAYTAIKGGLINFSRFFIFSFSIIYIYFVE